MSAGAAPFAQADAFSELEPGDTLSCGQHGLHHVEHAPADVQALVAQNMGNQLVQPPLTGELRIATLLVDRVGYSQTLYTPAQIESIMYTSGQSLKAAVEEMSYQSMTVAYDPQNPHQDIFQLSVTPSSSTVHCNFGFSQQVARDWHAQTAGTDVYTHTMVVIEGDGFECGGVQGTAGLATYLYGGDTTIYINSGGGTNVFVHELGHTLGRLHAGYDNNRSFSRDSGDIEYGDPTCTMGNRSGNITFNMPYRLQTGWYQDAGGTILEHPVSGDYDIYMVGPTPAAALPQAMQIPLNNSGRSLILSYRNATQGADAGMPSQYRGRLAVHWQDFNNDPYSDRAMLVELIDVGGIATYTDKDGATVTVEVKEVHPDRAVIALTNPNGSGTQQQDTTAPTIQWLSPVAQAAIELSSGMVSTDVLLQVRIQDAESAVAQVELMVNGQPVAFSLADADTGLYEATESLTAGSYTASANAEDSFGNTTQADVMFDVRASQVGAPSTDDPIPDVPTPNGPDVELDPRSGPKNTPLILPGGQSCTQSTSSYFSWLLIVAGLVVRRYATSKYSF